jgi:hypothetical protein
MIDIHKHFSPEKADFSRDTILPILILIVVPMVVIFWLSLEKGERRKVGASSIYLIDDVNTCRYFLLS